LALLSAALASVVLFSSSAAHAYPWMIRHGYSACNTCHYDPSGAGAIHAYGRLVADSVMRQAGATGAGDAPESSRFLFGLVHPPEWLDLGGDARLMALSTKTNGVPLTSRTIWMQLDLSATINAGNFVATGTLGYAPEGALGAALTRSTEGNLTSRQHWLGYQFGGAGNLLLRAGRMNLPYGIRTIEHTLWVRKLTRTTINDDQQYGAAAYFELGPVRGELMGIVGNLQLRPDRYRERGYSAYFEAALSEGAAIGASSLVTHRNLDTVTLKETWRQTHGVFVRYRTPYEPLMMLGEYDYVFESGRDEYHQRGHVGYLQADWEPVQGIHVLATGEFAKYGRQRTYPDYGGWLSYAWFFAPHCDLRLDGIYQSLGSAQDRSGVFSVLLQGHIFL
jgi:hypothetical protein